MPAGKNKEVAGIIKTEVPGVWMVAAGAAGTKIPTEHDGFMRFLQQVSKLGSGI